MEETLTFFPAIARAYDGNDPESNDLRLFPGTSGSIHPGFFLTDFSFSELQIQLVIPLQRKRYIHPSSESHPGNRSLMIKHAFE